jgi:hypothetical protein
MRESAAAGEDEGGTEGEEVMCSEGAVSGGGGDGADSSPGRLSVSATALLTPGVCRMTAVRSTAIFSVAIRLENTTICQYSVTNLSADFSKIVKSISRHFTSTGPLFEVLYIFDARLYKFKTNTRHIV